MPDPQKLSHVTFPNGVYNRYSLSLYVGIVQQCQMLESELNSDAHVLEEPSAAIIKMDVIKSDFEALPSSASTHPSVKLVTAVAETTSWCSGVGCGT